MGVDSISSIYLSDELALSIDPSTCIGYSVFPPPANRLSSEQHPPPLLVIINWAGVLLQPSVALSGPFPLLPY